MTEEWEAAIAAVQRFHARLPKGQAKDRCEATLARMRAAAAAGLPTQQETQRRVAAQVRPGDPF